MSTQCKACRKRNRRHQQNPDIIEAKDHTYVRIAHHWRTLCVMYEPAAKPA